MASRFSLRGVLGIVGLFAVCLLTFVNASHLLSRIVLTVVVVVLLSVLLGSMGKRGSHGAVRLCLGLSFSCLWRLDQAGWPSRDQLFDGRPI